MTIPSHSPLLTALADNAVNQPDKTFVITHAGKHYSYSQTWDMIRKAALFLQRKGLSNGDRVLLSAEKEEEFIFFYFGAHLLGVINVVVDVRNNASHLDYIRQETGASLAIGFKAEGLDSVLYSDVNLDMEPLLDLREIPSTITPEDTADIMFTSGTTGNPKGVRLSHRNIYSSAKNINSFIQNGENDVELLALPICHSFGLGRIRCTLLTGATVVLHNGFANLKSVFDTIEKYHVTGFGMVPAVWAYMRKFSGDRIGRFASQLRYIEIGSARMPLEDKKKLCELFPTTRICMHYGLTEASRAMFMEFHENMDNLETVGKPATEGVIVRICDVSGKEAEAGEEGEICIKGDMVTVGYLKPDDNRSAFTEDGYFRTGDCGYKDSLGRFYLKSRIKELINVGGKKVNPIEIEDALEKIGVGESMAIAITDPDGVLGEVPKVLLVKGTYSLSEPEIRSRIEDLLPPYKRPRLYEQVDSIPKTASGKKKRTADV